MSVMCRDYISVFLDICFVFEMVALASANTQSSDVFPAEDVSSLSKRSWLHPFNPSDSETLLKAVDIDARRVERSSNKQGMLGGGYVAVSDGSHEEVLSRRGRLAMITSEQLPLIEKPGRTLRDMHDYISQSFAHDAASQSLIKRRDTRKVTSLTRINNILTKRDYHRLSHDTKTGYSPRTRSVMGSDFWKPSLDKVRRQLVKRDSSLLTGNCGPLGHRCQHVPMGQCVSICINSVTKTICKTQNRRGAVVCLVYPA